MSREPDGPYDLVTGATGMLGSHIAEKLVARGRRVRALVRPGSDTRFLQDLGVDARRGRPDRPRRRAAGGPGGRGGLPFGGEGGRLGPLEGVPVGLHRRDPEPRPRRRSTAGVGRFLHISSTSAYGHPAEGGPPIDETAPMGQNLWVWDAYTRSKVESEKLLWGLARVEGPAGDGDPPELALRRARPDDDRAARRPAPRPQGAR